MPPAIFFFSFLSISVMGGTPTLKELGLIILWKITAWNGSVGGFQWRVDITAAMDKGIYRMVGRRCWVGGMSLEADIFFRWLWRQHRLRFYPITWQEQRVGGRLLHLTSLRSLCPSLLLLIPFPIKLESVIVCVPTWGAWVLFPGSVDANVVNNLTAAKRKRDTVTKESSVPIWNGNWDGRGAQVSKPGQEVRFQWVH